MICKTICVHRGFSKLAPARLHITEKMNIWGEKSAFARIDPKKLGNPGNEVTGDATTTSCTVCSPNSSWAQRTAIISPRKKMNIFKKCTKWIPDRVIKCSKQLISSKYHEVWTFSIETAPKTQGGVLESLWKPHKSKDLNFLHRSYTPKKFPTPKKIFFFGWSYKKT